MYSDTPKIEYDVVHLYSNTPKIEYDTVNMYSIIPRTDADIVHLYNDTPRNDKDRGHLYSDNTLFEDVVGHLYIDIPRTDEDTRRYFNVIPKTEDDMVHLYSLIIDFGDAYLCVCYEQFKASCRTICFVILNPFSSLGTTFMWCIIHINTFGLKANKEFIRWFWFSIDIYPLCGIIRLF